MIQGKEEFDVVQAAWTLGASAVGAFVAGLWGTRVALGRMRSERAFERRLQWSEEIYAALHEMASAVGAMRRAMKGAQKSELQAALSRSSKASLIADQLQPKAYLYYPPAVAERLTTAIDDARRRIFQIGEESTMQPPAPHTTIGAYVKGVDPLLLEIENRLREAAAPIAVAVRSELNAHETYTARAWRWMPRLNLRRKTPIPRE